MLLLLLLLFNQCSICTNFIHNSSKNSKHTQVLFEGICMQQLSRSSFSPYSKSKQFGNEWGKNALNIQDMGAKMPLVSYIYNNFLD